jgi:hypothetical protein
MAICNKIPNKGKGFMVTTTTHKQNHFLLFYCRIAKSAIDAIVVFNTVYNFFWIRRSDV